MSWPLISIEKLVKISKGKKHNLAEGNAQHRYIQIGDLRNDNRLKYTDDNKGVFVEPQDLIIAWDGANAGTIGYNLKGLIGSTLARLTIINTDIDTEYLGRFLQSKFREIRDNCTGATIPHVSKVHLISLKIPLPSLPVQKQIAAVLEKADTLRGQCQQMEQELNTLTQSVFLDMFGDPVTNPKGWKKDTIANLAEVKSGLQVTHRRSINPIEVPYLRVANVYRDYLKMDEVKFIKVTQSELDRTMLIKGDMLVVEGHGNKLEIGRSSIWDGSIDTCTHQNHLIRVRFNINKILPDFVSCYLNSDGGRLQVLSLSKTTSGLNTISSNNVRSLNLIVPPLNTQKKFLSIYFDIRSKVQRSKKLYDLHNENFNSLMQRAFKGELELKDVA